MFKPCGRGSPSPGVHSEGDGLVCVLLTVTTEDRVPWLANEIAQAALVETWRERREGGW